MYYNVVHEHVQHAMVYIYVSQVSYEYMMNSMVICCNLS